MCVCVCVCVCACIGRREKERVSAALLLVCVLVSNGFILVISPLGVCAFIVYVEMSVPGVQHCLANTISIIILCSFIVHD